MKPDDFEKQLERQPFRDVPPEWREEILKAARASSIPRASRLAPQAFPWWHEWLWPAPQAWAGLAAAWLVILGVNMAPSSPEAPTIAANAPAASAATATNLFEQRRELARLLDPTLESAPARKSPAPPGPRSELLAPPRV